nr:hypothetical protein [Tanacetum cinerariifolium]
MVFRLVDGNSFDCPPDSYHPPYPTYETYSGDTCGNDSHFSYDCTPQFPLNYEPEPGYIHNYNSYPHDSPSFPQQYPCCEDYGSSVENLVPNPSESEGENECDVPASFTTFSNVLFDADYDSNSSDNQSLSDEDFSKKIYLDPLFDEEIIHMEIDPHSFNAESDLIKSMPNHDSSIIISSKIDSLFDDFAEIVFDNSIADIESFSPSHIPNEDSDSHMEEIDLSFNPDDPMPPGIEDDHYDSKRDIPILEELLDNYSLSLPANELYHFDIPSPYRPPTKPPDGNTGNLNIKMMGDISERK